MLEATVHTICEICHLILLFGTIRLLNLGDLPLLFGTNVLARHALSRYDNAFLQNDNAFLSFQITPISMSNNCIFWRYE